MTDLDTKNGKPFEAASEYLYQKKIEELEAEVESLKASMRSWEVATEIRIGATLLNENQKLREALETIDKEVDDDGMGGWLTDLVREALK